MSTRFFFRNSLSTALGRSATVGNGAVFSSVLPVRPLAGRRSFTPPPPPAAATVSCTAPRGKGPSIKNAAAAIPPPLCPKDEAGFMQNVSSIKGLPSKVRIIEVGPRDGLQAERMVSTDTKVELITRLASAGCSVIEAASFVSPKWVPQMADSEDVIARLDERDGVSYACITPNMQGLARALNAGVQDVSIWVTAQEGFSMANTNCTIAEHRERNVPMAKEAIARGVRLRGYVSCAFRSPMDRGVADPALVRDLTEQLLDIGCHEVSIADTTGSATPGLVHRLLSEVCRAVGPERLAVHFHDTYGQALSNILVALQLGVASVDSSVGGLGGCPYAPGATGNVATEDVVYMLHGMGVETGIDLSELVQVGDWICNHLEKPNASSVGSAIARTR